MNFKLFTTLGLIGLVAIFVTQNAEVVEIRFLFWTLEMSRALMFIFLLVFGIVIGWFLRGIKSRDLDRE